VRACPECHTPYPDDQGVCPIDGQQLTPPAPPITRTVQTRDERSGNSSQRVAQPVSYPASRVVIDDSEEELLGKTLGSYRVLSVLGKGGMGQVYLGEHIKLGRRVALKILRPEFAAKRDAVARFFQEAKAVSRIRHKNIVDVTDFVEDPDGTTFIVMELLEGMTLGEKFRRKHEINLREGLSLGVSVCDGLEAAHREGIIHRDLKPDNIFLCTDVVKLLDFGVAKLMGEADAGWQTMQGSVVGTPAYMSPEQAAGISCDHRADIYSLGTILYEIFTGRRVFEAKSFGEFVLKHMSHEPVPPRDLKGVAPLPRELERTILKCLEKKPEDRFATAAELRAALVESLAAMETASVDAHVARAKRRRSFYLGLSIGAAGLAAVLIFLLAFRNPSQTQTQTPTLTPTQTQSQTQPVVEQLGAAGQPAQPPRAIQIKFHSEPEGAEVLDPTGAILGRTPLSKDIPGDGAVREYLFRHDGFRDKRMRVACDQDRTMLAILEHQSEPMLPSRSTDHARPEPAPAPRPAAHGGKIGEHVTVDPFKDP
jgi:eukaryotic-like serine/threonine-protein kinase